MILDIKRVIFRENVFRLALSLCFSLFLFSHSQRLLEGHPHLIGLFSLGRRIGTLALPFSAQQLEISVLCSLYDVTVSVLRED